MNTPKELKIKHLSKKVNHLRVNSYFSLSYCETTVKVEANSIIVMSLLHQRDRDTNQSKDIMRIKATRNKATTIHTATLTSKHVCIRTESTINYTH